MSTSHAPAPLPRVPMLALAALVLISLISVAVVRWSGTATQGGEFLGEPASDVTVNLTGVNMYRISCGQIVESWSEMNALDVLHQIHDAEAGDATPAA